MGLRLKLLKNSFKRVFQSIDNGLGLIIIKDFKSKNSGSLSISLVNEKNIYGAKLNSLFFKKITVSSKNIKYLKDSDNRKNDGFFKAPNGVLIYTGSTSVFGDNFEDGNIPENLLVLSENYLPISNYKEKTNDFLTFTNSVKVATKQVVSIGGVLSDSANNGDVSSIISLGQSYSKLEENLRMFYLDSEGSIDLTKDNSLLKLAIADYLGEDSSVFLTKYSVNRQEVSESPPDPTLNADIESLLKDNPNFLLDLDPLSPVTGLIKELVSNSYVQPSVENNFVAILPEVSQFIKDKTIFGKHEYVEGKNDYKMFITTFVDNTSVINLDVPYIEKIIVGREEYLPDNFENIVIKPNIPIILYVRNYNEEYSTFLNGLKLRETISEKKINDNLSEIKITLGEKAHKSYSVASKAEKASNPERNYDSISFSNGNPNYNIMSKQVGSDAVSRYYKSLEDGQFVSEIRETQPDPEKVKDDSTLRLFDDIIDGGRTAASAINSFCDFSFSMTTELKGQLKGFKQVLTVIKVIFCIIDVLCALMNPQRLGFAIIRLFNCLFDLVLLLPQLSVPVMLLSLCIHLLKLLDCLLGKIIYYINAINQIISSIDMAISLKNFAAVKNAEENLKKYGITFKAELDVMKPVQDIIDLFNEMLNFILNFPCQVSDGDGFCIDSSMVAGIISSQIQKDEGLFYEALLPIAQDYTTLNPDDTICGNTPESKIDTSSFSSDGVNCNFGDIFKQAKDFVDSGNVKVCELSSNSFIESITVNTETNRVSGFPLTYHLLCLQPKWKSSEKLQGLTLEIFSGTALV